MYGKWVLTVGIESQVERVNERRETKGYENKIRGGVTAQVQESLKGSRQGRRILH